jgi:two-component sensor histidine kinase
LPNIKYAFPEGRSGTVKITVSENTAGRRTLCVENDGVPIPEDFNIDKQRGSLGLSHLSVDLYSLLPPLICRR